MKALIQNFSKSIWTELAYVTGGLVLLCAASKVLIPLDPIPITLQPMAVLLLALTYKKQRALQSVVAWIALGAVGLPVFAGWVPGNLILVGPSAGYIYSYILVTALIPYLREKIKTPTFLSDMGLSIIATLINYSLGIIWLSAFAGFEAAIQLGLLPFIIPGIVKAVGLCGVLKGVRAYRS